MEWLLPVAGIVVGIAATYFRGTLRPRWALARLRRGRPVVVPATLVSDGRPRRARLARVGDDVHVVSARDHAVVPATQLASAASRGSVDADTGVVSTAVDLVAATGHPLTLRTEDDWAGVLQAVIAPSAPGLRVSGRGRGRRIEGRRWPVGLAALALTTAGIVATLMVLGTERTSPVVSLVDEGYGCVVTWQEAGQTYTGAPTCPDPTPAVGDPITYVTTPWPVSGSAWDLDLPWVLVALLALIGVVGLAGHLWRGVRSRRLKPQRVAIASTGSIAPVASGAAAGPQAGDRPPGDPAARIAPAQEPTHRATTFDEAVDEASARLGWDDVPPQEPPSIRSPLWSDAQRAWSATPRVLTLLLGLGLLGTWDQEWPDVVRAALASLAVGSAVRSVWVFGTVYVALRRTWSEPFTSEWRTRVVQDGTGMWHLVLMLGATPRWLVALPGRPADTGTCLVRGDLTDGGSVHLLVDEQIWLPTSPAARVDDAMAADVLEDLRWQADGHRADATAGRGTDRA